jgi:hypothetical protein
MNLQTSSTGRLTVTLWVIVVIVISPFEEACYWSMILTSI